MHEDTFPLLRLSSETEAVEEAAQSLVQRRKGEVKVLQILLGNRAGELVAASQGNNTG